MIRTRAALAVCFALPFCSHPQPPSSGPSLAPPPAASASGADAHGATREPAPPTVTVVDARELFDRWLAAQNHGDFTAYEGLYAARFTGVRRSGAVTRALDRGGWMHERRAMFAAAQQVEARDVTIAPGTGDAVVHFTQSWTSGSYHDEGPKVLVVISEGGSARIAREELLRSAVGTGGSAPQPLPAGFMLTLPEAPTYVVLAESPDESLAAGPPTMVSPGSPVVTRRAVDPARLSPSLAALIGRRVRLYGPSGEVCSGTLEAPAIVHRVEVHFGVRQRWADGSHSPHTHPLPLATVAQEAWDDADRGSQLTAMVGVDAGACQEARWARLADLPELPVFTSAPADAANSARALAAFRETHAWHQVQAAYAADASAQHGAYWDQQGEGQLSVRVWHASGSQRTFVTVDASVQVGGCAGFSGQLWGLYEIVNGAFVRLTGPDDPVYVHPQALVDVDGDGIPEVVGDPGLVRRAARSTNSSRASRIPTTIAAVKPRPVWDSWFSQRAASTARRDDEGGAASPARRRNTAGRHGSAAKTTETKLDVV